MPLARPPRDPAHEPLRSVRLQLLRLHKALIDAERAVYEKERGALTNMQLLRALTEEEFFAWLRPFSGLIAEIDGALMDRDRQVDRAEARAFVERASALVSPSPLGMVAAGRLQEARRRDPGVLFVHGEVVRAVAEALIAYEGSDG